MIETGYRLNHHITGIEGHSPFESRREISRCEGGQCAVAVTVRARTGVLMGTMMVPMLMMGMAVLA